jgi:hypothetical protein
LDAGIGEFAENQRLAGAESVANDAGDFDGERLGFRAAEDSPDFATLAGLKLVEGDDLPGGRLLGEESSAEEGEETNDREETAHVSVTAMRAKY